MNSSFLPGRVNMYASSSRRFASFCQSSPGIFAKQRALQVHDLVVRQRHDEALAVLVQHREGQLVVMKAPVDRILLEVVEGVVHPPHVPLEREARARPRSTGFVTPGHAVDSSATVTQPGASSRDRLVELAAGTRSPRGSRGRRSGCGSHSPACAAVVEVEHRRDGVDAQPVDVELVAASRARSRRGSCEPRCARS